MNTSFRRTIANDVTSLGELMADATTFMEQEQIDADAVYRINLVLEEMISNIIKYAYDDRDGHQIMVLLKITDEEVVVVIEDNGHEFNPLLQPEKDLSIPLEQREIGGLGLHLIRKMLNPPVYRRENDRNVLEIGTRRKSPARSA